MSKLTALAWHGQIVSGRSPSVEMEQSWTDG